MRYYVIRSNETPQLNPHDFVSAEWLSPQEIIDKIDAGVPAKTSIKDTLLKLIDRKIIR